MAVVAGVWCVCGRKVECPGMPHNKQTLNGMAMAQVRLHGKRQANRVRDRDVAGGMVYWACRKQTAAKMMFVNVAWCVKCKRYAVV